MMRKQYWAIKKYIKSKISSFIKCPCSKRSVCHYNAAEHKYYCFTCKTTGDANDLLKKEDHGND